MSAAKKARRAVLETTFGCPDPKAVERDIAERLEVISRQVPPAIASSFGATSTAPTRGASGAWGWDPSDSRT